MPFSAALISVNASARAFTSVAITWSACRAASSACAPFPVPMSSARLDPAARRQRRKPVCGRREARDPAFGVVLAAREAVEREQQALGGDDARARHDACAVLDGEPDPEHRVDAVGAERIARVRHAHSSLEEKEPQHRCDGRVRQPALEDRRLRAVDRRAFVAEQLLDRLGAIPGGAQRRAKHRCGVEVGIRLPHARTAYGSRTTP